MKDMLVAKSKIAFVVFVVEQIAWNGRNDLKFSSHVGYASSKE